LFINQKSKNQLTNYSRTSFVLVSMLSHTELLFMTALPYEQTSITYLLLPFY